MKSRKELPRWFGFVAPEAVDMQPRIGFEVDGQWVIEDQPINVADWVMAEPPSLDEQLANLLDFVEWQERRP